MIRHLADMTALFGLVIGAWLWLRATRGLRSGGPVGRAVDSFIIISWLAVVFFALLASVGLFRLGPAVVLWMASGLLAGLLPWSPARAAVTESPLDWPDVRRPALWAAAPLLLVVGQRLLKGMVAPQMAWDSMTYHLPKIAFWVQSGKLTLPDFPDAWTYYRFFPAGAEMVFAWVVLPFRSDLLLGPAGLVVWLMTVAAVSRLAYRLSASRQTAWLTGLAVGALPALLAFMTATYSDTLLAFCVSAAVFHVIRFAQTGEESSALLAAASLGLTVATKISSLPAAALLLGALAFLWLKQRRPAWQPVLGLLLAAAPGSSYLATWLSTGSPFYPFKAPLLSGLPFHDRLHQMLSGQFDMGGHIPRTGFDIFVSLFWSPGWHVNFGLGGFLLGVVALVGAGASLREGRSRLAVVLCLLVALSSAPGILGPGSAGLRTFWIDVMARGLLAFLAPLLACAACAPRRLSTVGLVGSLLLSSIHFWPIGWSPAMTIPAGYVLATLLAAIGVYLLLRRSFRAGSLWQRSTPLIAASVLVLLVWHPVRARARHAILSETSLEVGAFDASPVLEAFSLASPIWRMVDQPEKKKIAVTAGRDKTGHNQFLFPLFGSRLQNELVYVPVTTNPDELLLEPSERYLQADPDLWLRRLEASRADLIVGLWPPTPERDWLFRRDDLYQVGVLHPSGAPWVARRKDNSLRMSETTD